MYDSKYFATTPEGSVTLRPDFIQKLKCASGEHEPEPYFLTQLPWDSSGIKRGDVEWHIRKCKHCNCLYVEE